MELYACWNKGGGVADTTPKPEDFDLSATCGIFAMAMLVAWLAATFSPTAAESSSAILMVASSQVKLAAFAGAAAGFGVIILSLPKTLSRPGRVMNNLIPTLGSIPLSFGSIFIFHGEGTGALELAAWFLAGIAIASLLFRTGLFLATTSIALSVLVVAVAATLGALVYLLAANLNENARSVVVAVLPLAATCLFEASKELKSEAQNFDQLELVRSWHFSQWQAIPVQVASCLALGFSLSLSLLESPEAGSLAQVFAAVFLAGALLFFTVMFFKRNTVLAQLQWYLSSLIALLLLPLLMPDAPSLVFVCCVALLNIAFVWYGLLQMLAISDLMRENRCAAVAVLSSSLLIMSLGMMAGWGLHLLSYSLIGEEFGPLASRTAQCAVVALLIVLQTMRGRPRFTDKPAAIRNDDASGSFRQACAQISDAGGLTKREAEVFVMLAKGRNSVFISDSLCIASHTAKAHIYRIYQKLDIHSQQDLIDAVETSILRHKGEAQQTAREGFRSGEPPW